MLTFLLLIVYLANAVVLWGFSVDHRRRIGVAPMSARVIVASALWPATVLIIIGLAIHLTWQRRRWLAAWERHA